MPDVTMSFTDAQWTRIVAASSTIKQVDESGDIDANYISTRLKTLVASWVKQHEEKASVEDF
tara:strand:- start:29149 stop:29334 length:186 start_codon:yes stop_codon:yes gene_type:complete